MDELKEVWKDSVYTIKMKKSKSVVKDKYFEFTCRVVFFCIHQIGHTFFHVLFSHPFSGNMFESTATNMQGFWEWTGFFGERRKL